MLCLRPKGSEFKILCVCGRFHLNSSHHLTSFSWPSLACMINVQYQLFQVFAGDEERLACAFFQDRCHHAALVGSNSEHCFKAEISTNFRRLKT